ncbi:MAG: peptidoglycan editing factor PgeF [Ruminococcaceae bacterium]|nr:peptidoglycan editing factor PgeF [Oscillospiraceae bacterium]
MQIRKIGKISLYQSKVFEKFPKIVHGFTTREGGVSKGQYESLSLSPYRGDDIECVHKNEEILCDSLDLDYSRLSSTKQEHTDNIEIINKENIGIGVHSQWGKGVDAVITREKNVPILCYSADCVPIIMYASDIEAIAAIHSGWKGTQLKIAEKTAKKLIEMGANSENIYTAIGPCIGKCCYEVSGDVAEQFDEKYYTAKDGGKYMLDLEKANFDMLLNLNIPEENISVSGICTKCNNDLFFSHRGQGGKSGTLGGIICIKG